MNLKSVRDKLRISQAELAKLAHVRRVHILGHEKGYRKLSTEEMYRVERACRKEADKLIQSAAAAKRMCFIRIKTELRKTAKRKAA